MLPIFHKFISENLGGKYAFGVEIQLISKGVKL